MFSNIKCQKCHPLNAALRFSPLLASLTLGPYYLQFDFPGGLRSSTNSNNKISFLQDKNIHPVVFIYINNSSFYRKITNKYLSYYILLYQSLTPGNWSLILTFWLKGWKAESNYWTWFFSQYKWSKDGVHQVCLAFFGTT